MDKWIVHRAEQEWEREREKKNHEAMNNKQTTSNETRLQFYNYNLIEKNTSHTTISIQESEQWYIFNDTQ